VTVDAAGIVDTAGCFQGTVDFDPGPGTYGLSSAGGMDLYVSRFRGRAVPAGDIAETLYLQRATGADITLSWGHSCSATDDDFAIDEGTIGSWYSHLARFCSTGGATTATFKPAPEDSYCLVVPRNAQREGAYGAASSGPPRLQGVGACAIQEVAPGCP
jgi:hypothetical protein